MHWKFEVRNTRTNISCCSSSSISCLAVLAACNSAKEGAHTSKRLEPPELAQGQGPHAPCGDAYHDLAVPLHKRIEVGLGQTGLEVWKDGCSMPEVGTQKSQCRSKKQQGGKLIHRPSNFTCIFKKSLQLAYHSTTGRFWDTHATHARPL